MEFQIKRLVNFPELKDEFQELINQNWDEIGTLDDVGWENWFDFIDSNTSYQFGVYGDGKLAGVGNCAPIWEEKDLNELPDRGWQWALRNSLEQGKGKPIYVSAISATISKDFRGMRISQKILEEFKKIAGEVGANALIAPVRPTKKSEYPLISMEDYITWKREDGTNFDSWLRIHEGIGGEIKRISKSAMVVTRTVDEWKEIMEKDIQSSGLYLMPGAHCPIKIDLEKNIGVYEEDGVWIHHRL